MVCNLSNFFDAAAPGTGPARSVVPTQSVEFEKYNKTYNYSIKSKSDFNLNPQPEGNVFSAYPKAEQNRSGVYAIETDRGELSATAYTQINANGSKLFQARLQDDVRPTMKETTLYAYDGTVAPITKAQSDYSQFIPQYSNIGGKQVRIGGSDNFGLRTATEYSYIPGAAPTGINTQAIQNPDARQGYTWQRPDKNVDGASTFKGAIPDGTKFQQYRPLPQPESNALKFNYNLETGGHSLHDYSQLLGKKVDGIENRYTASYQIAPLFTNPLHVIWDPDNKGEIPAFFCDPQPLDYAYEVQQNLPKNEYNKGSYNSVWTPNKNSTSANAYILGMEPGVHNPSLEWYNAPNVLPGVTYDAYSQGRIPDSCYGGSTDVFKQYTNNQRFKQTDNTYTTLGDPLAGFIGQSVNTLKAK
jgi:hypothetical protein